MKFIYVDESGALSAEGDVFVMCGLMVDVYKLRKKTADFSVLLKRLLEKHPGKNPELKTKAFINGKGGWSQRVEADERKRFLMDICQLAVANGGKIFGIGLSFQAFEAAQNSGYEHPFGKNYWLAGGMFISSLVQKKMQQMKKNKGHTVLIIDDNKAKMSELENNLYQQPNAWYDGLYQRRGKGSWLERKNSDRLDQIINIFAIKSNHSSLVQVADAICYVYRRHLELAATEEESWEGEKTYYQKLVNILNQQREKLGQSPDTPSVKFYKAAKHPGWRL